MLHITNDYLSLSRHNFFFIFSSSGRCKDFFVKIRGKFAINRLYDDEPNIYKNAVLPMFEVNKIKIFAIFKDEHFF